MTKPPHIAAIILAAGQSTRMGDKNKLLLDLNGKPMLQYVIDTAATSRVSEIIIVTGHEHEKVEQAITSHGGIVVHNAHFEDGMASSIRVGIEATQKMKSDGALILLGDMPYITADHIDYLITHYQDHSSVCVPYANNRRGNPVLWGREHFSDLLTLTGDQGARDLIKRAHPHVTDVKMDNVPNADAILKDIDSLS